MNLDLNSGALAPVSEEVEQQHPKVSGEIPAQLHGTLMRNGPNPYSGKFDGHDMLSWWPEAAMLHAIHFQQGSVQSYKNRWVRTQNWAQHTQQSESEQWANTNPNVNVIQHAGHIQALAEGGQPLVIDHSLETLGAVSDEPYATRGMTAHPKLDPRTGELMIFRSDWSEPWLRYGIIDANGKERLDQLIDVPAPAMMHDLAITKHYSILMDLNVGYDFSMFEQGYRIPIRWQDERRSRLCVIPRHGGEPTWLDIDPCFIQHIVNAYEDGEAHICLDVVRYPWFLKGNADNSDFLPNPLGVLWRYHIDLQQGKVIEQPLDDLNIELPRINEAFTGSRYNYFYAVEQPSNEEMRGIVCYDLKSNSKTHHVVNPGDQNSEPIFVPAPNGTHEQDGWVLVCVYRAQTDTTELRILDAKDISQPALATVHLEHRIPAGFHGAWIPSD